jgi:hypothetical protein
MASSCSLSIPETLITWALRGMLLSNTGIFSKKRPLFEVKPESSGFQPQR